METPHPAEGEVDVFWTEVLLVLVEFVGCVPVMKTLIPLLLHFLVGVRREVACILMEVEGGGEQMWGEGGRRWEEGGGRWGKEVGEMCGDKEVTCMI